MVEAMLQNAGTDYTVGGEDMPMLASKCAISLPGKRRAAGDVARAETARREAELKALERQVTAEIRRTYAPLRRRSRAPVSRRRASW
jgi:hypothetical protein